MTRAILIASLLFGAGCPDSGVNYCDEQSPCGGGDVCAHTHECLAPDQVHAVTIRWTIGRDAPDATACNGISEMNVGYERTDDPSDRLVFSPVTCTAGSFPNDKWPTRYDTAYVAAFGPGHATEGRATIPPDPNADVTVDLPHP
ncbi:MAG TPA: hypothetical protein VL463_19155 [Kofleriaceae bacterium]|jgi:hypothetical protein|nr:hypothetical protein [Kofleriaceae bacterium]